MRFLLYNIRYGTGGRRFVLPTSGYLGPTSKNLGRIVDFIKDLDPDIIGLVEVDAGSYRSSKKNQAQTIAESLSHYHTYGSKYRGGSLISRLPLFNKQGNAFISRDSIKNERFHYFDKGTKRLVMELETEDMVIFLVHLALGFRIRHHQLSGLYSIVKNAKKPYVVAGDFNAFWGEREIHLFQGATGLINADPNVSPSYPSWAPRQHLDFVLHSPEIKVTKFQMPQVILSDHLPIVCDFEVNGKG